MDLRILHISDTHGVHRCLRDLPKADILVHSGDFTMSGSEAETLDFLEWLCDLPYRHKVLVAGNHDACLYGARLDGLDDNVHYLCGCFSNSFCALSLRFFMGIVFKMLYCRVNIVV